MHHVADRVRLAHGVDPPQPGVRVAGVKRLEAVAQVPLTRHLGQSTGQILRDNSKLTRDLILIVFSPLNQREIPTTPPPKERSQFPMSVLATMSGMVSGWDQPTASTAIAM